MMVGKGTINKSEPSFNGSCSVGKRNTEVSGIIMLLSAQFPDQRDRSRDGSRILYPCLAC